MKNSNIDKNDCLQNYPELENSSDKNLLKRIPESKKPEGWPETWCFDVIYKFDDFETCPIELIVKPKSERDVYGVVGWEFIVKRQNDMTKNTKMFKTKKLEKAFEEIEENLDRVNF